MDFPTLLSNMRASGVFEALRLNTAAQFGSRERRYLGATILPEKLVNENSFTEETIEYRTVVANDGTRYSPVQIKGGALVGEFDVKLAEQDIGSVFTSREYDALRMMLRNNLTMQAEAQLTRWFDMSIVRALIEKIEKQRWEAIVDASVPLRGDNSYTENVAYSDPTGHRALIVSQFTDNTVDPLVAIYERAAFLRGKGMQLARIITSDAVRQKILNNTKILARTGPIIINQSSALVNAYGAGSAAGLNNILVGEGLPAIETYDLMYRTTTGTQRFLKAGVMVFIAATGRDESIDRGDAIEILPDTLGYAAVGRPAGKDGPGRALEAEAFSRKPPRIEGEGWQTSLPVITQPEAIATLYGIT